MSKPGLCCDACYDLIAKRSDLAASLWLELCEIQIRSEVFGLKTPDSGHMQLLETLGYIITTETKEYIMIKVQGRNHDSLGDFFCRGNCGK